MSGRVILLANPRHADAEALEAAIELACWQRQPLHAVLLRDTAALRGAALAGSMEVQRHGGEWRPLREHTLKALLQEEAEGYQQVLQRRAEQAGLRVGMDIHDWPAAAGVNALAVLLSALIRQGDSLVAGRSMQLAGQPRAHPIGLAGVLRECTVERLVWAGNSAPPARPGGRVLLLLGTPDLQPQQSDDTAVVTTATALRRADACLRVALELSRRRARPLTVLLVGQGAAAATNADSTARPPRPAWLEALIGGPATDVRFRALPALGSDVLAAQLRAERGLELVVDRGLLLDQAPLVDMLSDRLRLPLTVVDCAR
jgi:hypothetical protein